MSRTVKEVLAAFVLMTRTLLSEMKDDLGRYALPTAIRNVRNGIRHCCPRAIADTIVARYPHCYMLNASYRDFPRLNFVEYRSLAPNGNVPLVRVNEPVLMALAPHRVDSLPSFREKGATLVRGDGLLPLPSGAAVIAAIQSCGWRILTVDDAQRVLNERSNIRPEGGYLGRRQWISNVEDIAGRMKVTKSLFAICEDVVATRQAVMVIYTPGLPKPFRLWQVSLKATMPALPPLA
ncbi:hypothetical protein [Tardiphaga sp.]|uniref:hypothetical protein n=1 Tax=Tardiphaga sp. TaxID=1926292 RepID=UPI002612984B|nr:hypothetical protein [Tardiphaga sp.]MDB5616727.1 hypothetical protein [Tardiphaga sp.]